MANAFKKARGKENITPSLKNKNITADTKIPFVIAEEYIEVPKNDKAALSKLQQKVKQLPRGTYKNQATGYEADINSNTIKKASTPTHKKFNWFSEEYISNLNGILKLPELFERAIYVDTMSPMKNKKDNPSMKGFHHFVAPLRMRGRAYRALITAREKENSNTLYVLRVEVLPIEKTPLLTASSIGSQSVRTFSNISIPDLIRDVKIYDYDMQENKSYTQENLKYSLVTNKVTIPCPTEREPSRKRRACSLRSYDKHNTSIGLPCLHVETPRSLIP